MDAILTKIVAKTRETVAHAKEILPLDDILRNEALFNRGSNANHDFVSRLRRLPMTKLRIIGEIKRASPSKGLINDFKSPVEVALKFRAGEVDALSVLTDEPFFQGRLDYLDALQRIGLPLLRKDFIIDEYQVYESLQHGADAVLLIVSVLGRDTIRYAKLAAQIGLAALVEVHSMEELKIAIDSGAPAIGVNNRDLQTFAVNLARSEELLPSVPPGVLRIAESGIFARTDAKRMEIAGADALLIGESLMKSPDVGAHLRMIRGQTM